MNLRLSPANADGLPSGGRYPGAQLILRSHDSHGHDSRAALALGAVARGVAHPEGETDGHAGAGRHARRAMEVLGGRGARLTLLLASLLAGLVIALLTVHLAGQWRPVGIHFRIHR